LETILAETTGDGNDSETCPVGAGKMTSKANQPVPVKKLGCRNSKVLAPLEKGQSLLETAFVLPFLILLLAIVVDATRTFDALIVLTNAVRQGARYASLEPSPAEGEIKQLVVNDVVGSGTNITNMNDFDANDVKVEIVNTVAVTVTASYDFPLWFGGILGFPTLPLEKSAVIRHTEETP
jgi:hypothetical protein